MTGRDDELLPDGVPAFDDPAYDALRAELADLGEVGPMPADVAARLDDVLADLTGSTAAGGATVVPLRRRRSTGRRLLVAAAAVVAVGGGGIGLANVLEDGVGGSDSSVMAEDSATAPEAAAGGGSTGSPNSDALGDLDSGVTAYGAAAVPKLDSGRFADQARTLIRDDAVLRSGLRRADRMPAASVNKELLGSGGDFTGLPTPGESGLTAPDTTDGGAQDRDQAGTDPSTPPAQGLLPACAVARVTGGVARPVLLDGTPAILVVYAPVDGSRLVQARSCDATTVLISVTVPAS